MVSCCRTQTLRTITTVKSSAVQLAASLAAEITSCVRLLRQSVYLLISHFLEMTNYVFWCKYFPFSKDNDFIINLRQYTVLMITCVLALHDETEQEVQQPDVLINTKLFNIYR